MSKGGSFEIKVARMFTKWVTDKEKPEILWRSVSLGPKATIDRRKGGTIRKIGDLIAIDPLGQWLEDAFLFECKHHKKAKLTDLLKSKSTTDKSNVLNWWNKCQQEAKEGDKIPFLIFRANNQTTMVMTYEFVSFKRVMPLLFWYITPKYSATIFPLIDFFQYYKAEQIKQIVSPIG